MHMDLARCVTLIVAVVAVLLPCLPLCADGTGRASGPEEVVGQLDWPTEWVVFPSVKEDLAPEALTTIPERPEVAGETVSGQKVQVEENRLDLAPLFGGVKEGNTAYVFLALEAENVGEATLGLGADWYFQAWLNGQEVLQTLGEGNGAWPPQITNHTTAVTLTEGTNVLAVKFVSGTGSSVLAIGGPDQLRQTPSLKWVPVARPEVPDEGGQVVPNHNFSAGGEGDPYIPRGWHNGRGPQAFRPGEMGLRADGDRTALEIDTIGRGADATRRLYVPLAVDVATTYEVSYQGEHLGGDDYLSISVRNASEGADTSFISALGNVDISGGVRGGRGSYKYNHLFDAARPYLVIQAHGEVHALIYYVSILPLTVGAGTGMTYQHIPWTRDWMLGTVSDEVETPHTAWAKPYAGGELKVTTVLPRWHHRWTVELAQRLSVSYLPIMIDPGSDDGPSDYWIRGDDGEPKVYRTVHETLMTLASPADCIVIGHLPAELNEALVDAVLDRVKAGAGLVIMEPTSEPEQFREGPWVRVLNDECRTSDGIASLGVGVVEGAEAEFYRYGDGRIVFLPKLPVPGSEEGLRGEFEAQISYAIKAIVWASNRLPVVLMSRFVLPGEQTEPLRGEISRDGLPAPVEVSFSAAAPKGCALRWWLDDYDARQYPGGEAALQAGSETARIELPRLPGGEHWLHLQLVDRKGAVLDWNTLALNVSGVPTIGEVTLARDRSLAGLFSPGYYVEGERLTGRVVLEGEATEGSILRLRLTDVEGHLWVEEEVAANGAEIEFALDMPKAVVMMHRLEVALIGPDGTQDLHTREITVVREQDWYKNNYGFQIWGVGGPGYLGLLGSRELGRTQGVDSAYRGNARTCAYANIRSLMFTGRNEPGYGADVDGDAEHAPVRHPCPSNPGYSNYIGRYFIESFEHSPGRRLGLLPQSLPYAPLGYDIAHEVNLLGYGSLSPVGPRADVCFCEFCVDALSELMRAEYGDLAALNASWSTSFRDWGEVRPIVLEDALQTGQITRWIDHRRNMDRVWTDAMQAKIDVVRRHDPNAQAVADNFRVPTSFSGVDYWQLVSEVVGGSGTSYLREFSAPERSHLTWLRYSYWGMPTMSPGDHLFRRRIGRYVWEGLLNGLHGSSYWTTLWAATPHEPWFRNPVAPDLRTTEEGRWSMDPVAHIRTGIDRLVFDSEFDDSGVAILYSRSSEHAATAWQAIHGDSPAAGMTPDYGAPLLRPFTDALSALGYGHRVVSEQQVADGFLSEEGIRLLILPFAQAIDVETAAAIREYVGGGGLVLADIRPAVADRHGHTGGSGLLDDVFGVTHEADWHAYRPVEADLALSGEAQALTIRDVRMPIIAGPAVTPGGAQSMGAVSDIPMMMVNRHGDGRAVLLNFRPSEPGPEMHELMEQILEWGGLQPLFGLETLEVRRPKHNRSPEPLAPATGATARDVDDAEVYVLGQASEAVKPALAHFTNRGLHVFAFWYEQRRGAGTERLRVTPPATGHIYDLLTNQYLGERSSFDMSMPLEDVRVYAVTPYRIEAPKLSARSTATAAGNSVIECRAAVSPRGAAAEPHVVRLQLFAPDGEEWRDFAVNVVAANGVARYSIVLPLNAPAGTWRVTAREAISGLSDQAAVGLIQGEAG